jgi:hypothetical protein
MLLGSALDWADAVRCTAFILLRREGYRVSPSLSISTTNYSSNYLYAFSYLQRLIF